MFFSRQFSAISGFLLIVSSVTAQEIRHVQSDPASVSNESHLVAVSGNSAVTNTFEFSLYPNPAHSIVYYRLPILPEGSGMISLIDSAGVVVFKKEFNLQNRSGALQLPEFIPAGKYTVMIASEYGISKSVLKVCGY